MTFARLAILMFLQFFVWGAWYVTLGTYLSSAVSTDGDRLFSDALVGDAFGTAAIAAIITPFLVGLIADRFFASERVLGVLHLLGAGALYLVSDVTDPSLLYLGLLAHFVCYMPTISLSTSLSLENLKNPDKVFPVVRVFGTIGWIVAGLIVGLIKVTDNGYTLGSLGEQFEGIEATSLPIKIAAAVQVVLGIYSFFLPHTPPKAKGEKVTVKDVLGLDAISLFKKPAMLSFIISSLLICIPLQFYYTWTNRFLNELGVEAAAAKMTLGQFSEVGFMLLLPLAFVFLGVRWILAAGMAAWVLRYLLFAFGNGGDLVWMLYGGILLHGICYDFFFVAGQIFVDSKAPPERRASAQGFLTLATLGVGMFIGSVISGRIVSAYPDAADPTKYDWHAIWLYPAGLAAIVTVGFLLTFSDRIKTGGQSANLPDGDDKPLDALNPAASPADLPPA
ncbi:nucleoside permease [Stratiformator vulcanicus]|uniref:Nucleoside transporter YegT n=1 Tax=Stratiformator vulcanicus TaxID=2527980 RepID=A0A517R2C0_9PLAN|nr:nucleoside permease [Stratiformator vulcanicus]QDT38029.1 Putative nucleoside transporter YegT [Stratiformator vulcanicus]